MTEAPVTKKRRLDDDAIDYESHAFENIDPFLSPATASSWPRDEFAFNTDYLASQEALRSLLFNTARSGAPTRDGTPDEVEERSGAFNIKQVLSKGRRVQYLRNYIFQVAPWLDMFDSTRVFGIQLPALAKESPPLLYALLAIGARQLERKEKTRSSFDSLELYQEVSR